MGMLQRPQSLIVTDTLLAINVWMILFVVGAETTISVFLEIMYMAPAVVHNSLQEIVTVASNEIWILLTSTMQHFGL